jgi:phosphatidylserine decarboxylase
LNGRVDQALGQALGQALEQALGQARLGQARSGAPDPDWVALGLQALGGVPGRALGRLLGYCARRRLPAPVRRRLLGYLVARFQVDLADAEKSFDEYRTLHEMFTRRLRPGARPIDPRAGVAVSPVDGFIAEHGEISEGRLLQAKGRDYTLAALLADRRAADLLAGGTYATLYLHPRSYHRIHAPVPGRIVAAHAVPGRLVSVSPLATGRVDEVFARNERIVTLIESSFGLVAVVMVGAAGVGNITATFDANLATPVRQMMGRSQVCSQRYQPGLAVAKGDELGIFHLGSTVIVVFARGRVDLERHAVGQPIRLGQPLAVASAPPR